MAVRMFSAIDVGSHEIEMKIFELSRKNGIRQIEDIRHRIDLGTDTYHTGKISSKHLAGMRKILQEFSQIMKNYQVEAYRACGTSAFREMQNASIVVSRLEQVTGIRIEKAKELLTGSALSMKEICAACGYQDPNYFSRNFKKKVGLTPTEYKEKYA